MIYPLYTIFSQVPAVVTTLYMSEVHRDGFVDLVERDKTRGKRKGDRANLTKCDNLTNEANTNTWNLCIILQILPSSRNLLSTHRIWVPSSMNPISSSSSSLLIMDNSWIAFNGKHTTNNSHFLWANNNDRIFIAMRNNNERKEDR